jgi:methylamine dehydrogenase heavy chain
MLRAYLSTLIAVAALAAGGAAFAQIPPTVPSAPIVEESDVATLPPIGPRWIVLTSQWGNPSTRIVDGGTGKQLATLHTASLSNVALDPNGKFFYVAETIWTKGNRGDRQDMLTIYDSTTLALVTEIKLAGRLLTGLRRQNLDISQDGRFAYVYDMSPASSVIVIDLVKRKVAQTVEIPGCGLVFSAPAGRVASLCGDGSLATISFDAKSKPTVDQTGPFFSADEDPIFDNSIVDRTTGKAIFLSYSGLIYETVIDGRKDAPQPWSLQQAAGLTKGSTAPLAVGWLPGGRQLIAYHPQTNRLYVLMHMGEFWSQKEDGTELWVVDLASRKVLKRHRLAGAASYVEVSREASPVVFIGTKDGVSVLDAETLEQQRSISVRGQLIAVAGR